MFRTRYSFIALALSTLMATTTLVACGDDGDDVPVNANNGGANNANNADNNANNANNGDNNANNANNGDNNANNANNGGENNGGPNNGGNNALPDPDPTLGHWVLVDNIHATKQNPDLMLKRDNYSYQGMHGYSRIFKHLEDNGYPYHQIWDGTLTPELLAKYEVLFINLVSEGNPDFTAEEITAIQEYVEGGGGLFVIADHTNVYYHADRINPILEPMGLNVPYYSALDKGPEYAIGSAWLKIRNYIEHPVTEGVRVSSFQTGGFIDTEHGVAFSSEDAYGDFWIEDTERPGFYGNWTKDEDEPTGPLPLVSANAYGQGRVVVVGDQNIFGDEWLYVGQNFELISNIFEWTAGAEDEEPPLREKLDEDFYHVAFDLENSDWALGSSSCSGFFPFFINFNRTPQIAARGADQFSGDEDALVFTNLRFDPTEEELGKIRAHLAQGKVVIIMTDVVNGLNAGWRLVEDLIPDLTVEGAEGTIPVADLPLQGADTAIETFTGDDNFPVTSPFFDIEGMRMSGHAYPAGTSCPGDIDESEHILRKVTSPSGDVFMSAEVDGGNVDLARIIDVDGGQVILFLQDGFWQNETLGSERQSPTTGTGDAHQIHYKFLDWLITQKQ